MILAAGAVYSNGVYFAVNASMATKYSYPVSNGYCYMYHCKVLTGDFTFGRRDLTEENIIIVLLYFLAKKRNSQS